MGMTKKSFEEASFKEKSSFLAINLSMNDKGDVKIQIPVLPNITGDQNYPIEQFASMLLTMLRKFGEAQVGETINHFTIGSFSLLPRRTNDSSLPSFLPFLFSLNV